MAITKSTPSSSNKATSMAQLLASHKTPFVTFKKSDLIAGTITKLTSTEILVDIGAKTEAVVLEKDRGLLRSLLSSLKVGDKVEVSILNPESDFGYPVVSLRRFLDEKVWEVMEKAKKENRMFEATVEEVTKGGFLIRTKDGMSGFLPNSHSIISDSTQNFIGKDIKVNLYELNRSAKKVIFSQKSTIDVKEFEKQLEGFKIGEKVKGVVTNIAPFGVFVSLTGKDNSNLEGLIHQSEVSWDKNADLSTFNSGDEVEAQVTGFDKEGRRVNLSIKRLTDDPYAQKLKEFTADKKVAGTVSKIISTGIIVDLGDGIEGIIKKDKIPPTVSFEVGKEINATVIEVDSARHRVVLVPVLLEKPMGYR